MCVDGGWGAGSLKILTGVVSPPSDTTAAWQCVSCGVAGPWSGLVGYLLPCLLVWSIQLTLSQMVGTLCVVDRATDSTEGLTGVSESRRVSESCAMSRRESRRAARGASDRAGGARDSAYPPRLTHVSDLPTG